MRKRTILISSPHPAELRINALVDGASVEQVQEVRQGLWSAKLGPQQEMSFFEPGPLRVYLPPGPSWGAQARPLNRLGARVATLALRMGLARLLDMQPETDNARRWGLAYRRTRAERIEAANRGDHLLRAARDTIFNCEAHHDHSAT